MLKMFNVECDMTSPMRPGEPMRPDEIVDLWQRGRVFYEMFPGTRASDAWRRHSALPPWFGEPEAEPSPSDAVPTKSTS